MGGGDAVTPRASFAQRARVGVVAALVVATTAGCPASGSAEREPNEVDEARAKALLDDPWLGASDVTMTTSQAGTNDLYSPTTAIGDRRVQGTPEATMRAELQAAGEAGWSPFYGQCPAATGADVPRSTEGSLMVLLVRELDDGGLAFASVLVNGDELYVRASTPNHGAPPIDAPPPVDVSGLACLDPDGPGLQQVGEAIDILKSS